MDFKKVEDWKQNELSKAEYGRMPWHDVAIGVVGPCVYDIIEHFVLRWNFVKRDKYKREDRFDWIMLRGREGDDEDLVGVQRPTHPVGDYILHPPSPVVFDSPEAPRDGPCPAGPLQFRLVQRCPDRQIHSECLRDVIRNAEHYVYIENQFFITATGTDQAPVHNTIGSAIVDAVVRASKAGRTFRVIVILPAVPGFAGDLREDAATSTRAIMDYQYKSICRGEHSIFEQIRAQSVDPEKYIFFFNLRSYDRLNRTPIMKKRLEQAGVEYQEVQRGQAEEIMTEGIHGIVDTDGGRDTHMGKKEEQIDANESGKTAADEEVDGIGEGKDAKRKFEAAIDEDDEEMKTAFSVARHAMSYQEPLSEETWEGDPKDEVENWIPGGALHPRQALDSRRPRGDLRKQQPQRPQPDRPPRQRAQHRDGGQTQDELGHGREALPGRIPCSHAAALPLARSTSGCCAAGHGC